MFEQDLGLEEMEGLAEGQVAKQRRTEEGQQGRPAQTLPGPTSQPVPVPPVQPPPPTDPMMASLSALLDAKFASQTATLDATIASRVAPIQKHLLTHDKALSDMKATLASQQKQIEALQRQAASDAGSTMASRSGQHFAFPGSRGEFGPGPGGARPTFHPTMILMRGWAKGAQDNLSSRSKTLLPTAVAQRLLATLFKKANCLEKVDEQKTNDENTRNSMGCYQLKVFFKPTVTRQELWDLRKLFFEAFQKCEIFEDPQDLTDWRHLFQVRVSVNVEASPWQAPFIASAGKFKALFHKHKSKQSLFLKVERHGPPSTFMWLYPSEQEMGQGECVASCGKSLTWKLDEAMILKFDPDFHIEDFRTELA